MPRNNPFGPSTPSSCVLDRNREAAVRRSPGLCCRAADNSDHCPRSSRSFQSEIQRHVRSDWRDRRDDSGRWPARCTDRSRIQDKFAIGVCDLDPLRPNIVLKTVFGLWVQLIDLDPKALAIGGRGHQVGRIQLPIIEITQGKGPCFSRCPKLQVDLCLGQNGDAVFPSCWGIRWTARLQTFDRQGIRGEISSSGVDLQGQLMHAGRLFISTKGVLYHLCARGLGHFLSIELKTNSGLHRTLPAQAGRRRGGRGANGRLYW